MPPIITRITCLLSGLAVSVPCYLCLRLTLPSALPTVCLQGHLGKICYKCLMARFSNAELRKFRDTSRCSACVHYSGCQLWLALLLMNDELGHPGLDIIVPDITKACPMFFPWSAESARRASGGPPPR